MNKKSFWLLPVGVLLTGVVTVLPGVPGNRIAVAGNDEVSYQLDIEASKKGVAIPPNLFGAFFEDINYGADGGLYAELVQNRSFEFQPKTRHWSFVKKGTESEGSFAVGTEKPLNANNPNYGRLTAAKGEFGIANSGFGKIAVTAGDSYRFSVYARSNDYPGSLNITLEGLDGKVYARGQIAKVTGDWKQYACILKADTTERVKLAVTLGGPGTVDLDMISLFPGKTWKNRENGLRQDLAQMLADLKLKFFAFSGRLRGGREPAFRLL